MLIRYLWNGKEINLTTEDINIKSDTLEIDNEGKMVLKGDVSTANIQVILNSDESRNIFISPSQLIFKNGTNGHSLAFQNLPNGAWVQSTSGNNSIVMLNNGELTRIALRDISSETIIQPSGITTPIVTQTSKEESKKNFEKLENALNIVKDIDIYKYNLKAEEDGTKKHIGFVIGDNYRYSKEVTSTENDGADIYSLTSVCLKAIQEQQELIEQLQNEIKELKGEK